MSSILKGIQLNEVSPHDYDSDWDYQNAVARSGRSRFRSSDSYDAHDAENDAYEMHKRFAATRARKEAEAKAAAEKAASEKLDELSPQTLASYKKKAGADASAADKRGDYARGNKRMSGIVKATKKEFDNDAKDVSEELDENLHKWFQEKWVRFGPDGKIRGACARGDDSEGKPKCLPQSKAHSLGKKGRASAASRKRREDPNPERSGKAINVNTKKKTNEQELDEACWKGYHKEGNKKMFGKTYPNCVKNTNEEQELNEFAPGSGDDDGEDYDLEYQVYQCNPENEFEFIGGPLYQNSDLGRAHDVAYKLHMKHPDKAFMIYQPSNEFSRGGYGIKDDEQELNEYGDTPKGQKMLAKVHHRAADRVTSKKADTDPKYAKKNQDTANAAYDRMTDVAEGRENYNGLNILLQKDDEELFVKASAGGRELGHVLFAIDDGYLIPQDLEVEERFRGQGIAQTMYDYVKSKGYKIRRSSEQTDAGAGFWDKHRPEQTVWEEHHSESCPHCGGEMVSEELMNEKKDACYYKVKSRYKVWPSAYASGALVKCRKKGASNWGTGGKSNESVEEAHYSNTKNPVDFPKTWHDVDKKLGKAVDKMSQAEKVKKGWAMDPSQRVDPRTGKKMVQKGVAEGLSKQFEIIYLDQSGERKRKIVSGTSKESVARQFKKQYKLEIEQVKQLQQGVAEGFGQKPVITYKDYTLQYDYQTEDDDPEGYSTATTYYFDVFKDGKRVGEAEYFDYFGDLTIRINGKTKKFEHQHPLASQVSKLVSSLPDEQKRDLSDPKFESQGVAEDQLDEKWTKKYKDSINCSNPKGFSQKAHCAGKQKNESAIMKGLKL